MENTQWVLYSEDVNVFIGQDENLETIWVETKEEALKFDHRDSQETKVKWFSWKCGCDFKPVSVH